MLTVNPSISFLSSIFNSSKFFLGFLNSFPSDTAVSLPNPSIEKQSGLLEVISKSIISSFNSNAFTISSPKWFQIRIAQTQVRGDSRTFLMPVIECRVGDRLFILVN